SSFDCMGVEEAHGATLLANFHSEGADLLPHGRVRTYILDYLAYAREKPRIVQHRLAERDAITAQMLSFTHKPARGGKGTDCIRSIVGSHATKFSAREQLGARSKFRGAQCSNESRRPSTDDDDV